ncbi:MAG: hypothetical protein DYG85_07335 [Chloroflexi bacterium CFX1]|nr:hypothetical protein [Chloroflexi bacterium CFX1]MCQ3953429.1 hypothetical protein [Chloroflexota bacterium]MDL1919918.1 hypothetical protein [Chloroflexi bacterium CFX5]NUQ58963.1 hypothetical protein [Anaerolineales bacterium]
MKNSNRLKWTLGLLLGLVLLAGVGYAGFHLGVAQSGNFAGMTPYMFAHGRGFDGGMMRGHGFDGYWGMPFFFPFWSALRLAFFIGLIWLGYALFKRSGWRLVKTDPAPAAVGEKPESA